MVDPVTRMYNREAFRRVMGRTPEQDEREERSFLRTVARADPELAGYLAEVFAGKKPVTNESVQALRQATRDLAILDLKWRAKFWGALIALTAIVVFGWHLRG